MLEVFSDGGWNAVLMDDGGGFFNNFPRKNMLKDHTIKKWDN